LSDLRESGAIEQDADMVMFLYRPEYYEMNQDEHGESNKGATVVKIAKHRNGALDSIDLKALLHIQRFVDAEENDQDFGAGLPSGFKPIGPRDSGAGGDGGAAMFIQKSSKMNQMTEFDEGFDEEDLF
jgi:replicative DNA helicase